MDYPLGYYFWYHDHFMDVDEHDAERYVVHTDIWMIPTVRPIRDDNDDDDPEDQWSRFGLGLGKWF